VPEDKKPVLNEIQRKLSEIQNRYQNWQLAWLSQ
jgi:hypothetical protein